QVTERMEDLRQAQRRLIEDARKAGMAEMNTGILHNIGNILNSVTISANEIRRIMRYDKMTQIHKVNAMLAQAPCDLYDYLSKDVRGRLIPDFFRNLEKVFSAENGKLTAETEVLLEKIAL